MVPTIITCRKDEKNYFCFFKKCIVHGFSNFKKFDWGLNRLNAHLSPTHPKSPPIKKLNNICYQNDNIRHTITAGNAGLDELSCKLYDNKVCSCASVCKTHDFSLFDRITLKDEKEHPMTKNMIRKSGYRANTKIMMFKKNIKVTNMILL